MRTQHQHNDDPKRFYKLALPASLMIIGSLTYFFSMKPIQEIFLQSTPKAIGIALLIVGFMWSYLVSFIHFRNKVELKNFMDVDAERISKDDIVEEEKILEDIKKNLQSDSSHLNIEAITKVISNASISQQKKRESQISAFENYFVSATDLLEEQSKIADKKASMLLDKGVAYSKNGIYFFIFTIVFWQIVTGIYGFQKQHIVGIISCSFLFVFIEFLSLWYLRQFRQYVDTSTYLLKVKSIFDRYMLAFLALKSPALSYDRPTYDHLLQMLSDDIKWPDTQLLKKSDLDFIKTTIEAMSQISKSIKSEARSIVNGKLKKINLP